MSTTVKIILATQSIAAIALLAFWVNYLTASSQTLSEAAKVRKERAPAATTSQHIPTAMQ